MPKLPRGPHRAGFTLMEALTSVTVLAILSVGVSMLYIQALQLYQRGSRESTSRDKAALALQRITPVIREAFNVDYPGPGLIMFTMPAKDAEGHYLIDPTSKALQPGGQLAIYQSDQTGQFSVPGHYIWQAARPDSDAQWTPASVLMDDVEDLTFTYAPSINQLELVQVAVTVGEGVAPGYFNRTEVAEVWLRNH